MPTMRITAMLMSNSAPRKPSNKSIRNTTVEDDNEYLMRWMILDEQGRKTMGSSNQICMK